MLLLTFTLVLGGLAVTVVVFRLAELGADRIVERRFAREERARAIDDDVRRMATEINDAWVRELTPAARDR